MSNRGRPPNQDERSLWDKFVDGIRPLSGREKTSIPIAPKKEQPKKTPPARPVHVPPPRNTANNGLDRKTLSRLKKGKTPIEGKIDLHNKNQDQAYHALKGFVTRSFAQNKRCLLVITGKGTNTRADDDIFSSKRDGEGVLKTRLSEWVSVPPLNEIVLRIETAHLKHGGSGAFYLYLRKNRPN